MRPVTFPHSLPRPSRVLRLLPAALLAASLGAHAQTPTPTPTPSPTPTPTPSPTSLTAGSSLYSFASTSNYDGANLVLDPDETIWAVSGGDNALTKISPDRTTATTWTFAAGTAPSSLLEDADGTFWITEIGGFNVAHFNPADGTLTQWLDTVRRPTSLVKRPDGKFWLPETGGYMAVFDPALSFYTYWATPGVYYLSYPWVDADGSLWSCDFIYNSIARWAPDMSTATVWTLPSTVNAPSKIVRLSGKLWISFYYSSQLGRFDETTGQLDLFTTGTSTNPYDIHEYRGLILYSDQAGQVGFLDPNGSVPVTEMLTSASQTPYVAMTNQSAPYVSTVTSVDNPINLLAVGNVSGAQGAAGSAVAPTTTGTTLWALAVDERRARIYFGTSQAIGALSPPPFTQADELYLPVASSGTPNAGTTTQVVTWNRGTADATGVTHVANETERLLPDGWIAGWAPVAGQPVNPGTMLVQSDLVGANMGAPGAIGSVRVLSDRGTDTFVWSRVSAPAPNGGTVGAAANAVLGTAAIGGGDTGFLFAPADATFRTDAGVLVVTDATGTISIVDAAGQTRATFDFNWPSGYRLQGTTVFDAFGLPALPSARIVCSVTTGSVLLLGTAYDPVSGDAVRLEPFRSGDVGLWPTLPGFVRGNGNAGSLQIFNAGTSDAHVSLSLRSAQADGLPPLPGQAIGSVVVPAGTVATVDLSSGPAAQGTLDLASDQDISAFATYKHAASGGGTVGYGMAAQQLGAAIPTGSRGVFLAATMNGAFASTLQLVNPTFGPATVTVAYTGADGTAVGSRTVSLQAQAVVTIPAWPAGQTTDMGRVDVSPAAGSAPVLATMLRQDLVSLDTDAIVPLLVTP